VRQLNYWDQCNFNGLCNVIKELGRSFDQATSKKVGDQNIEGDMTDTQIMALWLILDLCDWRPHEWGLMGNEVISDHGIGTFILSLSTILLRRLVMSSSLQCKRVQDAEWLRMSLKLLIDPYIVHTSWDMVCSAYTLDECHICECKGSATSYETRVGL
jgi:hypothetical protein